MKNPTDEQLKLCLAKMLPEKIKPTPNGSCWWWDEDGTTNDRNDVRESEMLHVCWLVEQTLEPTTQLPIYKHHILEGGATASWQQRALALCKVKGIEV